MAEKEKALSEEKPEKKRVKEYFYGGPIDGRLGDLISELLDKRHEFDEFVLFIDSKGGDPAIALSFYCVVKNANLKLKTIALANVCSAAVLVLLAGEERIAFPYSRFLLHKMRRSYYKDKEFNVEDLSKEAQDLESFEDMCRSVHVKVTGKDSRLLGRIFNAEKEFNARTALELGLITEIKEL
jgi:ATP-dependent protease ClpP protease subunit